jgi:polyisoprenyl-teichoic acid--peptidoglycan teichoic acid transferase
VLAEGITRRTSVRPVVGLIFALLLSACGAAPVVSPSGPAVAAPETAGPTATPTPRQSPSPLATPSSAPASTPSPTAPFTILLLGADSAGRTDAIMVVGVDPVAKRVTYASIPRDTVNIPLPGGGTFKNRKINEFYNQAGKHAGTYPQGPGRATADAVEALLAIRVDYYARTNFGGFVALVNSLGRVPINLPSAVSDDFLQVGPNKFGYTFPKGAQTFDGRKALIFVRIRHRDTDFARQRRQQSFVTAAGLFVLRQPQLAAPLMAAARKHLVTDFPLDRVDGYLAAMAGLDAANIKGVVLGPSRYETKADCPCGYALAPKLGEMRAEAAELFPWAVTD